MPFIEAPKPTAWRRGPDKIVAGVCAGLARQLGIEPWILRFAWVVSALCFGTGLLLYVIFWICLPRFDDAQGGQGRVLFGVCARISRRGDVDVAVARLLALLLFFISAGTALIGYIALYFLLPEPSKPTASGSF